jgi:hypothetical protein
VFASDIENNIDQRKNKHYNKQYKDIELKKEKEIKKEIEKFKKFFHSKKTLMSKKKSIKNLLKIIKDPQITFQEKSSLIINLKPLKEETEIKNIQENYLQDDFFSYSVDENDLNERQSNSEEIGDKNKDFASEILFSHRKQIGKNNNTITRGGKKKHKTKVLQNIKDIDLNEIIQSSRSINNSFNQHNKNYKKNMKKKIKKSKYNNCHNNNEEKKSYSDYESNQNQCSSSQSDEEENDGNEEDMKDLFNILLTTGMSQQIAFLQSHQDNFNNHQITFKDFQHFAQKNITLNKILSFITTITTIGLAIKEMYQAFSK